MAKKQSSSVLRGQVKLREKKLADGSSSLYLDINVNGKRHKEYLKLYQVVATNAQERAESAVTRCCQCNACPPGT